MKNKNPETNHNRTPSPCLEFQKAANPAMNRYIQIIGAAIFQRPPQIKIRATTIIKTGISVSFPNKMSDFNQPRAFP